jgi:hypothetical protein
MLITALPWTQAHVLRKNAIRYGNRHAPEALERLLEEGAKDHE